jgi:methyl-accepting chemotaxis protein
MNHSQLKFRTTIVITSILALTVSASNAAEDRNKDREKVAEVPASQQLASNRAEELSTQGKEVLGWANEFAKEVTQAIDGWLTSGAVTQERLFSYLYYPIPNTDPTKYNTDYDRFADRDVQALLDKYLSKSNLLLYAVTTDRNGYLPVHNRQFSQPLTGNRAVDLVNNRTKRIFGDVVGFRAARNQKPFLLQTYARDTGEVVADITVPIIIRGRHWGCVRIGFRQVERQQ